MRKAALERLGVTVITGQAVEAIDASGVVVAGRRIDAGTVIWGAGIKASPVERLARRRARSRRPRRRSIPICR